MKPTALHRHYRCRAVGFIYRIEQNGRVLPLRFPLLDEATGSVLDHFEVADFAVFGQVGLERLDETAEALTSRRIVGDFELQ
jgi:hypothetical protein